MLYLSKQPMFVVEYNSIYCFERFMALTSTALIMWWSYPAFLVYKFFRGRSFEYDFDEIQDEGKKLSIKQGTVYHYWGDSRYQTYMGSYQTHVRDFWLALIGSIPWLLLNVIYLVYIILKVVLLPVTLIWKRVTPWNEKTFESPLLWWSGAVEAGLQPEFPDNIYTNRFMIPVA